MGSHSRVLELNPLGQGRYRLTKNDGVVLEIFICECYSYGSAEYLETITKLGKLDAIIISSNWCGYTEELKMQCRDERVGLFNIRDFMAALNHPELWLYLSAWEEEKLKKRGLI
jgi:hypothetical protein